MFPPAAAEHGASAKSPGNDDDPAWGEPPLLANGLQHHEQQETAMNREHQHQLQDGDHIEHQGEQLDAELDDDAVAAEYLIVLRLESTRDAPHPGDPADGIVRDLLAPTTSATPHQRDGQAAPEAALPDLLASLALHDANNNTSGTSTTTAPTAAFTCPPPPPTARIAVDAAETLALAWVVYHVATGRIVHAHLSLCRPDDALHVSEYARARSGIGNVILHSVPTALHDALVDLDAYLHDRGWLTRDAPPIALVTHDASDLRRHLPNEARRKHLPLPAFLALPRYFAVTHEVHKWLRYHPDEVARVGTALALPDLCDYFSVHYAPGPILDEATLRSQVGPWTEHALVARAESVPAILRRCLATAHLVTALRTYRYPGVFTHAIDAALARDQFDREMSHVVHLAGVPDRANLASWFHEAGIEPVEIFHLVVDAAASGDVFVTFASHDDATRALGLAGRALPATENGEGPWLIEVAPSSPAVLVHAHEHLVPVPIPPRTTTNAHDHQDQLDYLDRDSALQEHLLKAQVAAVSAAANARSSTFSSPPHHPGAGGIPRPRHLSHTHADGHMRPGDWLCPACQFHNFASRHLCHKCATPNPRAEGVPSAFLDLAERGPAAATRTSGDLDVLGISGPTPVMYHDTPPNDASAADHDDRRTGSAAWLDAPSPSSSLLGGTGTRPVPPPTALWPASASAGTTAPPPPPPLLTPTGTAMTPLTRFSAGAPGTSAQTDLATDPVTGEWTCPTPACGQRNPPGRGRCLRCGAAMGAAAAAAVSALAAYRTSPDPPPGIWDDPAWARDALDAAAMARGVPAPASPRASHPFAALNGNPGGPGMGLGVHVPGVTTHQQQHHGMHHQHHGPASGVGMFGPGPSGPGPRGHRTRHHHPFHHSHHHHDQPPAMRPGDWICPNGDCRFQNFASRAMCLRCGTPSPTPPSQLCPVPFRPGDWLCAACAAHNFASRLNCVRCGCAKAFSLAAAHAAAVAAQRRGNPMGSSGGFGGPQVPQLQQQQPPMMGGGGLFGGASAAGMVGELAGMPFRDPRGM
ncbi:hypothetical protein GGF31_006653 [Allomyces arbusculus]|nr:hypothetical protein GGF31_006653 [Allomyces arbusculus]